MKHTHAIHKRHLQDRFSSPGMQVRSSKLLEDFVMQNPAMLCILKGPGHTVELANEAYLNKAGGPDAIGRPVAQLFPHIEPPELFDILDKVYKSGEPFSAREIPINLHTEADSETRYMDLNIQPLKNDLNEIEGLLAYHFDVTEQVMARKNSEEAAASLKLIMEAMPQITWTATPDGKIEFLNRQWYQFTGLSFEQTKKRGWQSIIHPAMREDRELRWANAINAGTEYTDEFLAERASDHTYRWLIAKASAVRNNEGKITQWVGTLTDIHDQRMFADELERQVHERTESLKNSNLELQYSNKSLEQFAYIASHDLQEPLRKVRTFTTIFQQQFSALVPDAARDLIRKIEVASDRMSALIRDVLNYSRITHHESGIMPTDLNKILQNVLKDFELLAEELNAVIETDELPVIEAIPLQMNQLLYNLMSNALKFSQRNRQPLIRIRASILEQETVDRIPGLDPHKQYTKITVQDNGIGFEQEFQEQIFMIFQRLNSRADYDGTGIGLTLCQKIVLSHHGLIWAEGKEGEGASFHIILPLKQPARTLQKHPDFSIQD